MLSLLQIVQIATATLGIDDAATQEQAKTFARNRWTMLWNSEVWPQARTVQPVTLTAGTTEVTLAAPMELPTLVRRTDLGEVVPAESEIAGLLADAGLFRDRAGLPLFWCLAAPVGGLPVLKFSSAPATTMGFTVIGKRTCPALVNDGDTPTIPGADLALVAHVGADLYEWQRQMGKAQVKRQEAMTLQGQMSDTARAQTGNMQRIVPWEGESANAYPFPYYK